MLYSKAPNIVSSAAIFTLPKDEDYCKQYTKFQTFLMQSGCLFYDFETNKQIIPAVLKFIKDTNRFDYSKHFVFVFANC